MGGHFLEASFVMTRKGGTPKLKKKFFGYYVIQYIDSANYDEVTTKLYWGSFVVVVDMIWYDILPSSAQAQAQLGAEIALFSQLWGTYTLHPTPYTLHPE